MILRRKLQSVTPRKPDGMPFGKITQSNLPSNLHVVAGKDPVTGKFVKGNKLGGRNSYLNEQMRVRNMIRSELPDNELRAFVRDWIKHARSGRGIYMVSLMERLCGKVADHATEERIQEMEAELERMLQQQPIVEL